MSTAGISFGSSWQSDKTEAVVQSGGKLRSGFRGLGGNGSAVTGTKGKSSEWVCWQVGQVFMSASEILLCREF